MHADGVPAVAPRRGVIATTRRMDRGRAGSAARTIGRLLGLGVATAAAAPGAAHAQLDRIEAAWATITFTRAGFDEVVALADEHHVLPAIPDRAWAFAATGALRTLEPPLDLMPRALLAAERRSDDAAWLLGGDVVDLPGCGAAFDVAAVRKGASPPGPSDVAELRRRRQARRDFQTRVRDAWARVRFGKAGFECAIAAARAEWARRPPDPADLPIGVTSVDAAAAQREARLWRQAAVHFLQGLDAHGSIYPTALFNEMEQESSRRTAVDVGLSLGADGGRVVISHVFRLGPAAQAGLRKGWVVHAVDGKPVAGREIADLNRALDGAAGTKIAIVAAPPGATGKAKVFALKRAAFARSTVVGTPGGEGTGVAVIQLGAFGTGMAQGIRDALADVAFETGRAPTAVVIDLRGNSGGWVKEAVAVADLFVGEGLVVSQNYRDGAPTLFRAKTSPDDLTVPLVALVDGTCKSSCELAASALQDADRAVVLGSQTYGKGSIQAVIDAKTGPWSVLLTIAVWKGPRGRLLQAQGVTPDIALPMAAGASETGSRETDLPTALPADDKVPAHRSALATAAVRACALAPADDGPAWRVALGRRDPWLRRAIDAVRCIGGR